MSNNKRSSSEMAADNEPHALDTTTEPSNKKARTSDREIYINLPAKNVAKTREFWTKMGFELNPKFSNDMACCFRINENCSLMLLDEPFFKGFMPAAREISQPGHTEVLNCLSAKSRDEVNALVARAIELGGSHAMPPKDDGWMYGWSWLDLDGHHWEISYMDLVAMLAAFANGPAHPEAKKED